jgi:predicted dehydrogenase
MTTNPSSTPRRNFLRAAAAANLLILKPELVFGTQRNSTVRLGLLGCGGRGSGVATGFIKDAGAHLSAIADLFEDRVVQGKKRFDEALAQKNLPPSILRRSSRGRMLANASSNPNRSTPFTSPRRRIPSGALGKAVAAGKHIYLEKPVAVDVPGAKRVIRAGEKAKGKLSLAVGFQIRHATPFVELAKRVHAGALGTPVCGLTYYYAGAIARPDWPGVSPATRRLRNWVHDRVLSGDIIVEQNIHIIDVTNWMLQGHPLKAVGAGGRAGREDKGDCYSHYNCQYTYPGDVHITMNSTQFIKGSWSVAMQYFGTRGNAEAHYDSPVCITGAEPWEFPIQTKAGQITDSKAAVTGSFKGALDDADPNKQRAFIASITSGNLLAEAELGAESALSAMLGRTAAYTGREVTWDELLRSNEVWDAKLDIARV